MRLVDATKPQLLDPSDIGEISRQTVTTSLLIFFLLGIGIMTTNLPVESFSLQADGAAKSRPDAAEVIADPVRPADLETALSQLLEELSEVQEELLEVLGTKCERIADGDLDGITSLQQQEESLGQRLQACHHQRGALLAMAAEEGLPGDTLGSLASSLTTANRSELTVQVKEASSRMRLLQHRSLTNWVLTQRSMLHLSQLLEIVATGGRLQPTYGRDESSISSGALVDKDA